MAAIARRADREEPMAATTGFLAEGDVHSVGAAAVRSDWTYNPNRGTTGRTASACRSPRQSRGSGGSVRTLTLSPLSLHDRASSRPNEEAVDSAASVDAQNAPPAAWKSRPEREIPTPPTARVGLGKNKNNDQNQEVVSQPSKFLRFFKVGNKPLCEGAGRFLDTCSSVRFSLFDCSAFHFGE